LTDTPHSSPRLGHAWSLQTALIVIVSLIVLLAWTAGGFAVSKYAQSHLNAIHDGEMRQVATLLQGLSEHELEELANVPVLAARIANGKADTLSTLADSYRYQVWSRDGMLLLGNFGGGAPAAMRKFGNPGFSWIQMDGDLWRVFSMTTLNGTQEIQLAERASLRQWVMSDVELSVWLWIIASFALVLCPAIWVLRTLLRPLRTFGHALSLRSPADLREVQLGRTPSELRPIIGSVNSLLTKVADAFERERGFTSLVSHELRTPLAELRLLSQAAYATSDPVARDAALQELVTSADRCAHLQEQLLTLSRLEASAQSDSEARIQAAEIVMDAVEHVLPSARRAGIKLSSQLDTSAFTGYRFGLLTLLNNLLGNAVRYTPSGGRVAVSVCADGADLCIRVDDSGPGIPPEDRERCFERFQRLGSGTGVGAGLGLSIVRQVARLHGAGIELTESPLGGLRVSLHLTGRRIVEPAPLERGVVSSDNDEQAAPQGFASHPILT
jgi:two-component system sensor histidine kinase QseC